MSGRLSVGALSATYVVPRAHPDETGVRLRLDRVARRLDRVLATPLTRLEPGREDEVWLFRRLDAAVELDLADDDDALARTWADGVARALALRLRTRPRRGAEPGTPEVADGIACFVDRAAQLAAFVADLADGTAWSRWWHGEFDGLRPLPASGAIEHALSGRPARGRRALARLAAADALVPVLRALGTRGAARIAEALYGAVPDRSEAPAAAAARALRRGLADDAAVLDVLVEATAEGEGASVAAARRAVAAAARERRAEASERAARPTVARAYTRLGGAFLLLRPLAALGASLDAETRLLVLRSALGRERAFESGADPVLAAAAGVDPDDAVESGATLAAELVRFLIDDGRTDGVARAVAPTSLGPLLLDPEHDVWLGIADAAEALPRLDGAALAAVEEELAYHTLPAAPAAVAPAGRALVRAFAGRLGGFERSSPQHLWRNVLDRTARVDTAADGLRVELGPAPLDVLLRLSGLAAERFDVPWLGEVELTLER